MSLFKEYICGQKFNQQTFQLNLSNLVEDEGWQFQFVRMKILIVFFSELSARGIYPQLNKRAFARELIDMINKHLHMVRNQFEKNRRISIVYFSDKTIGFRFK